MDPTVTICIPSFNRPRELHRALGSIANQGNGNWDVLVAEDCAPRRDEVGDVVAAFSRVHPNLKVTLNFNEANLGYDANLRNLIALAKGEYCLFLGDDDTLAEGALDAVVEVIRHHSPSVILRSWVEMSEADGEKLGTHIYLPRDHLFTPSVESAVFFFRRSVFVSGLVIRRESAIRSDSTKHDGSLLYQLHLIGRILQSEKGYYLARITAIRHRGGQHYFGSSDIEKGKYTPGSSTPAQSIGFYSDYLAIARSAGAAGGHFADRVVRDLAWHSFPVIAFHADRRMSKRYWCYTVGLARLGLWRHLPFWITWALVTVLGKTTCQSLIEQLKAFWGHTPVLYGRGGVPRR